MVAGLGENIGNLTRTNVICGLDYRTLRYENVGKVQYMPGHRWLAFEVDPDAIRKDIGCLFLRRRLK
jgi:hypothetical protein